MRTKKRKENLTENTATFNAFMHKEGKGEVYALSRQAALPSDTRCSDFVFLFLLFAPV